MIDGVLGVFVLSQLIFSTLKGGYRLIQTRTAWHSRLDGPPILPDSSYLWEVTSAFREAVALDLLRENYTKYPVRVSENRIWNVENVNGVQAKEGYSLSLRPDISVLKNDSYTDTPPDDDSHRLYSESAVQANETETTNSSHSNDFLEMMISESESSRSGNVTLHINYSRNAIRETSSTGGLENTSIIVMHDYLMDLPAYNQTLVPSPIQIRAYAAKEFAQLRSMFGITENAFRKSLVESAPFVSFQSNSKGAARVGGIFFFSPDGGYLIKSIKKDEVNTFLKMLPQYCEFMKQNGRTTLLTRFCGMYDICIEGKHHTLVIMNAVFPSHASRSITERFDLKGSSLGRRVPDEERLAKGSNAVLKDLDFIESDTNVISLKPGTKDAFLDQIRRDVSLLQNCSVIDYSLLVGVEPLLTSHGKRQSIFGKRITRTFLSAVHGSVGVDGGKYATMQGTRKGEPVLLYFGLIDFLQPFNKKKYVEWKVKSLIHESEEFSCIPPENYARRLLAFLEENIC